MTPQEYISSGILETYALGSATPAEKQEVEVMLAKHPEVKKALDEILLDIEAYATLHAVEPDSALREKILGSISSEKISTQKSTSTFSDNGKVVPLQSAKSNGWRTFAIAASIILVLSVGINVYYWANAIPPSVRDQFHQEIATATAKSDSLQVVAIAQQTQLAQRDSQLHVLAFLRSPMTQTVALNSMIDGHPMKAMVHWDMKTMQVAVDPMTLPATTENQKYVLWAIVDGKPINEGDFDVADNTPIRMMNTVPKADSFAISLEKTGKVESPAGPIYVMGKPVPAQP